MLLLRLMWRWEGGQLINRVGGKLALVNRSEGNSFKPIIKVKAVAQERCQDCAHDSKCISEVVGEGVLQVRN